MKQQHLQYLTDRGVDPALVSDRYFSDGDNLAIRYWDPEGLPYEDNKGGDYIVHRVNTGRPKFKAPACSGSRPYFSSLMPVGYLDDINVIDTRAREVIRSMLQRIDRLEAAQFGEDSGADPFS